MATTNSPGSTDSWGSPRSKGRTNDHAKNTLCRNITIYGYCKHEKDGCIYNHDMNRQQTPQSQAELLKKRLNVESPAFKPATLDNNGSSRGIGMSPKAANAIPFTPKMTNSGTQALPTSNREQPSDWNTLGIPEFVPGTAYDQDQNLETSPQISNVDPYNPFAGTAGFHSLDGASSGGPLDLYTADTNPPEGAQYYQQPNTYTQPLQHHLYAPLGPYRENLLAYQRTAHDFFIPDNLRQDLQRRAETTLQVLPNSTLPLTVEHFHSLVPLDTNNQKSVASFGFTSWIYKAVSSKDGNTYALRRLEGFRLTSEKAIASGRAWKRIDNASFVTIHDVFTTRAFGESCLVVVTDYHPLAKTLSEQHLTPVHRFQPRGQAPQVPEQTLWNYLVQLASALKSIHSSGLAARCIICSKVLVSSKNRIRLNSSGVLDVVQYGDGRSIQELQQDDMSQLGRLFLTLATGNPNATSSLEKSFSYIAPHYSTRFKSCILALLGMPTSPQSVQQSPPDINQLLENLNDHVFTLFDNTLHMEDELYNHLNRELENSRLVRLLAKLGTINERPEHTEQSVNGAAWSETGERYYLKLFRDYVFHQVDAQGRPVVDLGHIITCLNKLDAASEERISLVTRDNQNVIVVSYKELKRGFEGAFQDLMKAGRR